jgi:hypothetical protein
MTKTLTETGFGKQQLIVRRAKFDSTNQKPLDTKEPPNLGDDEHEALKN